MLIDLLLQKAGCDCRFSLILDATNAASKHNDEAVMLELQRCFGIDSLVSEIVAQQRDIFIDVLFRIALGHLLEKFKAF
jgi:hypothetical protein